jgi:hypothetical protein
MSTQTIRLIDDSRKTLATACVVDEGEYYGGSIDLSSTPADVRALFDEFEEVVNGQMFSFLDELQAKIEAVRIKAVFKDGCEAHVRDLQVFPSTADVSFKLAEAPTLETKLAKPR